MTRNGETEGRKRKRPNFGSGYPCLKKFTIAHNCSPLCFFIPYENLQKDATGWADHKFNTPKQKVDLAQEEFIIQAINENISLEGNVCVDSSGNISERISCIVEAVVKDAMGVRTYEEVLHDEVVLAPEFLQSIIEGQMINIEEAVKERTFNYDRMMEEAENYGPLSYEWKDPWKEKVEKVTFKKLISLLSMSDCFDTNTTKILQAIVASEMMHAMSPKQLRIIDKIVITKFNNSSANQTYTHVLDGSICETEKEKEIKLLEEQIEQLKCEKSFREAEEKEKLVSVLRQIPEGYILDYQTTEKRIKKAVTMERLIDSTNFAGYKIIFLIHDPTVNVNQIIDNMLRENRFWYLDQCYAKYSNMEFMHMVNQNGALRRMMKIRARNRNNRSDGNGQNNSKVNDNAPTTVVNNTEVANGTSTVNNLGNQVGNLSLTTSSDYNDEDYMDPNDSVVAFMKQLNPVKDPLHFGKTICTYPDLLKAFINPICGRKTSEDDISKVLANNCSLSSTKNENPDANPLHYGNWAFLEHRAEAMKRAEACFCQMDIRNYLFKMRTVEGQDKNLISFPYPYLTWRYSGDKFNLLTLFNERLPWKCISKFGIISKDLAYRVNRFKQGLTQKGFETGSDNDGSCTVNEYDKIVHLTDEEIQNINDTNLDKQLFLEKRDSKQMYHYQKKRYSVLNADQIRQEKEDNVPLLEDGGSSSSSVPMQLSVIQPVQATIENDDEMYSEAQTLLGLSNKAETAKTTNLPKHVYNKSSFHELAEINEEKYKILTFFQSMMINENIPIVKERFPSLLKAYLAETLEDFMVALGEGQLVSSSFRNILDFVENVPHLSEEKNMFDPSLSTYGNFILSLINNYGVHLNSPFDGVSVLTSFTTALGVYSMTGRDKEVRSKSAFKPGEISHGAAGAGKSRRLEYIQALLIHGTYHKSTTTSTMATVKSDGAEAQDRIIFIDEAPRHIVEPSYRLDEKDSKKLVQEKQAMTDGKILHDTVEYDPEIKANRTFYYEIDVTQVIFCATNILADRDEVSFLSRFTLKNPQRIVGKENLGVALLVGHKEDTKDAINQKKFIEYTNKIQAYVALAWKMIGTKTIPVYPVIDRLIQMWNVCISKLEKHIPSIRNDARGTERLYYLGYTEALLYTFHLVFCSEYSPYIKRKVVPSKDKPGEYIVKVEHEPFSFSQIQQSMCAMILPDEAALRLITEHFDNVYDNTMYDVIAGMAESFCNWRLDAGNDHTLDDLSNYRAPRGSDQYYEYFNVNNLSFMTDGGVLDPKRLYFCPHLGETADFRYKTFTGPLGLKIIDRNWLEISGLTFYKLQERVAREMSLEMPFLNFENFKNILNKAKKTKILTTVFPNAIDPECTKTLDKATYEKACMIALNQGYLVDIKKYPVDEHGNYEPPLEERSILQVVEHPDNAQMNKIYINVHYLMKHPDDVKARIINYVTSHSESRERNIITSIPILGFPQLCKLFKIKRNPKKGALTIKNPAYVDPVMESSLSMSVATDTGTMGKIISDRRRQAYIVIDAASESDTYTKFLQHWYPGEESEYKWIMPEVHDEEIRNIRKKEGLFSHYQNKTYPQDHIRSMIIADKAAFKRTNKSADDKDEHENSAELFRRMCGPTFDFTQKELGRLLFSKSNQLERYMKKNEKGDYDVKIAALNKNIKNLRKHRETLGIWNKPDNPTEEKKEEVKQGEENRPKGAEKRKSSDRDTTFDEPPLKKRKTSDQDSLVPGSESMELDSDSYSSSSSRASSSGSDSDLELYEAKTSSPRDKGKRKHKHKKQPHKSKKSTYPQVLIRPTTSRK